MKELFIHGVKIRPGEKANIEIPIAKLPTHTLIDLPIFIRSSLIDGPVVLISGGVHGDEINGIATAKKLLEAFDQELELKRGAVIVIPLVNIYGSPWQPEFYDWAFNLPKNGEELKSKWDYIPGNTDILITHGPAYGFLDDVTGRRGQHLGCELLRDKVLEIKPKIHVCGHIHTGWGHYFDGHTHFFNASVLDERYIYTQTPWDIEWDPITNEVKFL